MKKLLFLLALAGTLFCAGWAWDDNARAATGLTVFVKNESTVVTTAQVLDAMPAFQQAVTEDFARYWGVDAQLLYTDAPPRTGWQIIVRDDSDSIGALGYHEISNGSPFALVFARTAADNDFSWQLVFTHELFEMLADPFIDRIAAANGALANKPGRLWLVEVADPCEAPDYAYQRLSASGEAVQISDFVTIAWYRVKGKAPFDFGGYVKKSQQILAHGYASYWESGHWQQAFATRWIP